jgi:hypothetical protein
MTQYTPGPLHVGPNWPEMVYDEHGNLVAEASSANDNAKANAQRIMTTWNSHDELLTLAEEWISFADGYPADVWDPPVADRINRTRAAIAKARGAVR